MKAPLRPLEKALQAHVAAIRDSARRWRRGDPEALHDLRVAVRRLRASLAPWRDRHHFRPLRKPLRTLAAAMAENGEQRDREVQRHWLQRLLPHPDARLQAWLDTQSAMLPDSPAQDAAAVSALARDLPAALRQALRKDSGGALLTVRAAETHRLLFRIQSALGGETALLQLPEPLHALRLDCKRLRYLLEPLGAPAVKVLRRAQHALGDWRDVDSLLAVLRTADALSPAAEQQLLRVHEQFLQSAVNALQELGELSEADLS